MREILFRGQTRRFGEKVLMGTGEKLPGRWVYGGVLQGSGSHSIIYGGENVENPGEGLDKWPVYTDTLGQFTGMKDKNGRRIFEGDIVKTHYVNTRKNDFVEQVVFHNGRFCSLYKLSEHGRMWANLPDGIPHLPQDKTPYMEWCEVIGNIHDNPELLNL